MNWLFFMTSAKQDVNVEESFNKLISETMRIKYGLEMSDETQENEKNFDLDSIDSEIKAKELFDEANEETEENKNFSIDIDIKSSDHFSDEFVPFEDENSKLKKSEKFKIQGNDIIIADSHRSSNQEQEKEKKKRGFISRLLGLCCLAVD